MGELFNKLLEMTNACWPKISFSRVVGEPSFHIGEDGLLHRGREIEDDAGDSVV